MGKKSLFYPCVIALALLLLSWNSGECRPKCPQVLPGNYGGVFGGNGQKFGYARSSLWSYASQWAFVFVFNRWLGREIRKSNFKHWLEHVTTFPEIPDGDHWTTNYIGHPLLGASIYAFYKNRGFSDKASLVARFCKAPSLNILSKLGKNLRVVWI